MGLDGFFDIDMWLLQYDLYPADLSREEKALVDFYIALSARRFMGNSVSSFSALQLLERQHLGRWDIGQVAYM